MRKIVEYPLSFIALLALGFLLVLFHPAQVVARKLFGYHAHKKTVDLLNLCILRSLWIMGARISFHGFKRILEGRPLIIVANHQSAYDVPPVIWGFRKYHPKFISKKELGKHIPSISYNLRYGGSVIIDRQSGAQAIKEIYRMGQRMVDRNFSVCLFPEGTRTRTGAVNRFHPAGFKALLRTVPTALVVPFVIDGNHRLQPSGLFPMRFGVRIRYTVLEPIEPDGRQPEEVLLEVETAIRDALT
jgi:1-acyl-sn-glycerol-3-phosphate acyltransferase